MPPAPTDTKPSANPYDFIVNQAPKPKKPSLLSSQTSFVKRLLVIFGGAFGLIIVIIIIASIFSSKPKTSGLLSIAEQQATLISLAHSATTTAGQQITKNLAASVQLSLISNQLSVVNYLKTTGDSKLTITSLSTSQGAVLSKQLISTPANTFDSEYVQLTQTQLASYLTLIKQTFSSSDPASQKILLSNSYASANLLLKEANATSTGLQ